MTHSLAKLATLLVALTLLSSAPEAFGAEVYKWVDKDGRVHYSERKPAEANEKAVDLKVSKPLPQPMRPGATTSSIPAATFGASPGTKGREEPRESAPSRPSKSLSGGRSDDSNQSKCNLARDVLSGAVRHGNGASTDAYDRQVAENDVRLFCK